MIRRSKYGAVRTELEGIKFHSKREAQRWAELKLLEKAGKIRDLKRQVPIALNADGGVLVGHWVADFCYHDIDREKRVWCDAKGVATQLYRWKKKHVKAQWGIEIEEI